MDARETVGPLLIGFLPTMRRFALSLTRSPDLADDLVQAACERALANADGFVPGSRFDAWMFRIIRNLWIDRVRKTKTQNAVPIDEGETVMGTDGQHVADVRLDMSDTAQAIAALPQEQREVLVMVCVEGLSYQEAAKVCEVPVGTVMSRLARARKRLAEQLQEKGIMPVGARSPPRGGSSHE